MTPIKSCCNIVKSIVEGYNQMAENLPAATAGIWQTMKIYIVVV